MSVSFIIRIPFIQNPCQFSRKGNRRYIGKGITFIPELATLQLDDRQKELVRPFAIPCPTRQIILLTNRSFIRNTLLKTITQEITAAVPKEMLSLKATQALV